MPGRTATDGAAPVVNAGGSLPTGDRSPRREERQVARQKSQASRIRCTWPGVNWVMHESSE